MIKKTTKTVVVETTTVNGKTVTKTTTTTTEAEGDDVDLSDVGEQLSGVMDEMSKGVSKALENMSRIFDNIGGKR